MHLKGLDFSSLSYDDWASYKKPTHQSLSFRFCTCCRNMLHIEINEMWNVTEALSPACDGTRWCLAGRKTPLWPHGSIAIWALACQIPRWGQEARAEVRAEILIHISTLEWEFCWYAFRWWHRAKKCPLYIMFGTRIASWLLRFPLCTKTFMVQ